MRPKHPDWSCTTKPQLYPVRVLPKPPASFGNIQAVKVGPLALADSQGSINNRYWVCYQQSGVVYMRGAIDDATWAAPTTILTEADAIEALDFTFDQLGRAIVFYQVGTELRLWYFDSIASAYIKRVIDANAEQPLCGFDLIDDTGDPMSDAHIFYVKGGTIYERLQRDRYDVVYDSLVSHSGIKLLSCGMTAGNKFQVEYRHKNQRNGIEKKKVYQTASPAISNLNASSFEVGFDIGANFNSKCHRQDDVYLTLFEQSFCDQDWASFLIVVDISISSGSEFQYIAIKTGESATGLLETLAIFPLTIDIKRGSYRFEFLNKPDPNKKQFKFYVNGSVLIDEEISNFIPIASTNQSLKFGAGAVPQLTGQNYRRCLKAQFLNMYCIVNGARTDWPITAGLPVSTPSVPVGNTMTVYVDGKNGVRFF
jgi:hypothetical protein